MNETSDNTLAAVQVALDRKTAQLRRLQESVSPRFLGGNSKYVYKAKRQREQAQELARKYGEATCPSNND